MVARTTVAEATVSIAGAGGDFVAMCAQLSGGGVCGTARAGVAGVLGGV